eukprot:Awhi_evm1s2591
MYTINRKPNGGFCRNLDLYKGILTLGFENENLNHILQEILRKQNLHFLAGAHSLFNPSRSILPSNHFLSQ